MAINPSGRTQNNIGNFNRLQSSDVTADLLLQLVKTNDWNRAIDQTQYGEALENFIPNLTSVIVETSVNYTQQAGEDAYFTSGAITLTLLNPAEYNAPIQVKSRSDTLTITNPFGTVILPTQTGGSVTLPQGASVILWPTSLGWEFNG